MKKILYSLILFPSLSWGGFTVCHNGSGTIVHSSSNTAICVTYSIPPYSVEDHDRIKNVIKTVPRKYIKWTTEPVEMTQSEKDAVDTAEALAQDTALRNSAKSRTDGMNPEHLAFRAAMDIIKDEINILRALHSLPARNLGQLKTAIKNKIDSKSIDE